MKKRITENDVESVNLYFVTEVFEEVMVAEETVESPKETITELPEGISCDITDENCYFILLGCKLVELNALEKKYNELAATAKKEKELLVAAQELLDTKDETIRELTEECDTLKKELGVAKECLQEVQKYAKTEKKRPSSKAHSNKKHVRAHEVKVSPLTSMPKKGSEGIVYSSNGFSATLAQIVSLQQALFMRLDSATGIDDTIFTLNTDEHAKLKNGANRIIHKMGGNCAEDC